MADASRSNEPTAAERRCEAARDFEILILEALGDLVASPITPLALDECADKILSSLIDLGAEQRRELCVRLGDVRRRTVHSMTRGRP
jgi:hypothetical protein